MEQQDRNGNTKDQTICSKELEPVTLCVITNVLSAWACRRRLSYY